MFKIRKPKRAGHTTPQMPPNDAVPRFVARQCLIMLRMAHLGFDEIGRIVRVLPQEQKVLYQYLADVEIKPSFIDIMKLIDTSEERELFSPDEAASLRAGKVRDIQNSVPDVPDAERNGDGDVRA